MHGMARNSPGVARAVDVQWMLCLQGDITSAEMRRESMRAKASKLRPPKDSKVKRTGTTTWSTIWPLMKSPEHLKT